jgi:hypothetical protein
MTKKYKNKNGKMKIIPSMGDNKNSKNIDCIALTNIDQGIVNGDNVIFDKAINNVATRDGITVDENGENFKINKSGMYRLQFQYDSDYKTQNGFIEFYNENITKDDDIRPFAIFSIGSKVDSTILQLKKGDDISIKIIDADINISKGARFTIYRIR